MVMCNAEITTKVIFFIMGFTPILVCNFNPPPSYIKHINGLKYS